MKNLSRLFLCMVLIVSIILSISPVNLGAHAFSNGQNANLVIGQPDFTTSAFLGANRLGDSLSTFDSSGNLWVADESNNWQPVGGR